jgi:hypothetical protein
VLGQSKFLESMKSDWIMPPIVGGIGALAVTNVVSIIDLTTFPGSPANSTITVGADGYNPNPIGHFLSMIPDGGDIYIAFGPNVTSVTNVSTTAGGSLTGNTYKLSGNDTYLVPNKTPIPIMLPGEFAGRTDNANKGQNSQARYMALICATGVTSTARFYQSSP